MNTDSIKDGLDGLTKIESFTDVLYTAAYWVAVICVILFVAYIFVAINMKIQDKKLGINAKDRDNYLDD